MVRNKTLCKIIIDIQELVPIFVVNWTSNFFTSCSERLKVHEDSDDGSYSFIPYLIANTKHHVFPEQG